MEYSVTFDETCKYFIIETQGDFNIERFKTLAGELLTHEKWVSGTNCLFDYRNTNFLKTTTAELYEASKMHRQNNSIIGSGKSALVMKDLGNTGMGRMYESITDNYVDTYFHIFMDIDEARAWIMCEKEQPGC